MTNQTPAPKGAEHAAWCRFLLPTDDDCNCGLMEFAAPAPATPEELIARLRILITEAPRPRSPQWLGIGTAFLTEVADALERAIQRPAVAPVTTVAQAVEVLSELLLDLYPLTIANGSMSAGEQRQLADDMASHVGAIRDRLCAALTAAQNEAEELRQMVAFYQGEGEDEIPEEAEWKRLARIPSADRSPEQIKRLAVLVPFIQENCDPKLLRIALAAAVQAKERTEKFGAEYIERTDPFICCDHQAGEEGKACGFCNACLRDERDAAIERAEKAEHLHKLDHSLADQWQARNVALVAERETLAKGLRIGKWLGGVQRDGLSDQALADYDAAIAIIDKEGKADDC